jgi:hypothetical protein
VAVYIEKYPTELLDILLRLTLLIMRDQSNSKYLQEFNVTEVIWFMFYWDKVRSLDRAKQSLALLVNYTAASPQHVRDVLRMKQGEIRLILLTFLKLKSNPARYEALGVLCNLLQGNPIYSSLFGSNPQEEQIVQLISQAFHDYQLNNPMTYRLMKTTKALTFSLPCVRLLLDSEVISWTFLVFKTVTSEILMLTNLIQESTLENNIVHSCEKDLKMEIRASALEVVDRFKQMFDDELIDFELRRELRVKLRSSFELIFNLPYEDNFIDWMKAYSKTICAENTKPLPDSEFFSNWMKAYSKAVCAENTKPLPNFEVSNKRPGDITDSKEGLFKKPFRLPSPNG